MPGAGARHGGARLRAHRQRQLRVEPRRQAAPRRLHGQQGRPQRADPGARRRAAPRPASSSTPWRRASSPPSSRVRTTRRRRSPPSSAQLPLRPARPSPRRSPSSIAFLCSSRNSYVDRPGAWSATAATRVCEVDRERRRPERASRSARACGDYAVEFDDGGAWAEELAGARARLRRRRRERAGACTATACLAPLRAAAVDRASRSPRSARPSPAWPALARRRDAARGQAQLRRGLDRRRHHPGRDRASSPRRSTAACAGSTCPTTLLAMADSCIGGKTSLNLGAHKNLLGHDLSARAVVVHAPFVDTLTGRRLPRAGSARSSSCTCSAGQGAADGLRATLPALLRARRRRPCATPSATSLQIKRDYIEDDEFDRGRRNLLNFGHCFGHALETATGFAVPHGQAVVVGMLLADRVARRRGLLAPRARHGSGASSSTCPCCGAGRSSTTQPRGRRRRGHEVRQEADRRGPRSRHASGTGCAPRASTTSSGDEALRRARRPARAARAMSPADATSRREPGSLRGRVERGVDALVPRRLHALPRADPLPRRRRLEHALRLR